MDLAKRMMRTEEITGRLSDEKWELRGKVQEVEAWLEAEKGKGVRLQLEVASLKVKMKSSEKRSNMAEEGPE